MDKSTRSVNFIHSHSTPLLFSHIVHVVGFCATSFGQLAEAGVQFMGTSASWSPYPLLMTLPFRMIPPLPPVISAEWPEGFQSQGC